MNTRTCTGTCGLTLPETVEYFHPRSKVELNKFRAMCRTCYAEVRAPRRRNRAKCRGGAPVDCEAVQNLDVRPIREWLKPRMDQFGGSIPSAARTFRLDYTTLEKILDDPKKMLVSLDTVDKILVGFQCSPQVLPELYPGLYQW